MTVGWKGTILTSSDGITWTERTSGTPIDLYGVTFGNGLFVTVGESGTILTSPDGITVDSKNFWNTKRTIWSHLRKRTLRNGGFFWNHPHFPGWNLVDKKNFWNMGVSQRSHLQKRTLCDGG